MTERERLKLVTNKRSYGEFMQDSLKRCLESEPLRFIVYCPECQTHGLVPSVNDSVCGNCNFCPTRRYIEWPRDLDNENRNSESENSNK